MRLAIVKNSHNRVYRVVELIEARGHTFGVTLDATGLAGWETYNSKAAALKAARFILSETPDQLAPTLDKRVFRETPFHPVTSALIAD